MIKTILWDFDGTICSTQEFISENRSFFLSQELPKSFALQEAYKAKRYNSELAFVAEIANLTRMHFDELMTAYAKSTEIFLQNYKFKDTYNINPFANYLKSLRVSGTIYSFMFKTVIFKALNDLDIVNSIQDVFSLEDQIVENTFKPQPLLNQKYNKYDLAIGDSPLDVELAKNTKSEKLLYLTKQKELYYKNIEHMNIKIYYAPKNYAQILEYKEFLRTLAS
jgi:phosphoglycolate phosphatase-like HAD superfamily hydrolase